MAGQSSKEARVRYHKAVKAHERGAQVARSPVGTKTVYTATGGPTERGKQIVERAGKMARGAAGRAVKNAAKAVARRTPVAAAAAAGHAIGSKIYEKNATRIQDALDKTRRK